MPETINVPDEEDRRGWESLLAFVLVEGCTLAAQEATGDARDGFDETWGVSEGRFDGEALEVCLTVNGKEIPFRRTMELIEVQFGFIALTKAKELLEERHPDADTDDLDALVSRARTVMNEFLDGDRGRLYAMLGKEVMPWQRYTAGGDALGFVCRGWQRRRRNGEAIGGVLRAPHWTWVDWWAGNESGQVRDEEDDPAVAMEVAKEIVDWKLGLGERPEGFEEPDEGEEPCTS